MGFKITTDDKGIKVFRKDRTWSGGTFATYSTSVSSKKNDEWVSAFVDLKFKKGVELNDKSVIQIKDAFPVVETYKEQTKISYFVMDFDVVSEGTPAAPIDTDDWGSASDEDLPFAPITR